MKTLNISLLLGMVGLNVCQAQLDTNRVHVTTQATTIRLRDSTSLPGHKPLIVVQGKEMIDISGLDPYSIKSMDVIRPNDPRRAVYGSKGQYGVIVIELKPDSTSRKSPK